MTATTAPMPAFVRRASDEKPDEAPAEDKLDRVRRKARELRDLYSERQGHEEALERLNQNIMRIEAKDLLDLMNDAKMTTFGLAAEGNNPPVEFNKTQVVSAAIPEEKLPEALAWLDEEGHLDLVKYEYKVPFRMGDAKSAKRLEAALKRGKFEYSSKIGVLPQTLTAFVKRELAANHVVPTDLLGVYLGEKVEVTLDGQKIKKRKK